VAVVDRYLIKRLSLAPKILSTPGVLWANKNLISRGAAFVQFPVCASSDRSCKRRFPNPIWGSVRHVDRSGLQCEREPLCVHPEGRRTAWLLPTIR
jgi:hypothetical protein